MLRWEPDISAPASLPSVLSPALIPRTVLDVGIGIRPQAVFPPHNGTLSIGLDAHRPYLEWLREDGHEGVLICAEWQQFIPTLMDDSFEAVVALDFIEHLTRKAGERFLREAKRVAPLVVIFTPNGQLAQCGDAWHMGGDHWQLHRSAWSESDFRRGWKTAVINYVGHQAVWAVHERKKGDPDAPHPVRRRQGAGAIQAR